MHKRAVLSFSFIFIISFLNAQNWVQPNATWHYDYWTIGSKGFVKIEHVGDSLIYNKSTMVLQSTWFDFQMNQFGTWFLAGIQTTDTNYVYAEGDTVFYLQNNQFQKLFDFSKSIGDSYSIGVTDGGEFCNTTSTAVVSNVGVDNLGYQFLTLSSPPTSDLRIEYGNYNSRFGGGSFLFPQRYYNCDSMVIIDFPIFTFKCFQDDGMFFNPSGEDCEYMLTHLGMEEINEWNLGVYPNPATEQLIVESDFNVLEMKLIDTKGNLLWKDNQKISKSVDVSFLNPGMYFLVLLGTDSEMYSYRFVKN